MSRALARMAAPSIVKGERAAFFRPATGEDRASFARGSVSPRYSVLEKHFLDIPAFPLHVVSRWADGDVEDAAFTSGLSG